MGNKDSKKGTEGGTFIDVVLDRKCFQAGSALKGKIVIKIGSDG